jgi:hypothetical protein
VSHDEIVSAMDVVTRGFAVWPSETHGVAAPVRKRRDVRFRIVRA